MSSNTAGIIFVLLFLIILAIITLRAKRRQNIGEETEPNIEEISWWSVKEETSNRLVLKIEFTDTVFTFDLDSGIITRSETEATETPNLVEVPISQVDKILLTFEDADRSMNYAKLALITTQGEKFQIIRRLRYTEVVSPMAKKIAGFIHKEIESEWE